MTIQNKTLKVNFEEIFLLFSSSMVFLLWFSILMTELGLFYKELILMVSVSVLVFFLFHSRSIGKLHCSKVDLLVLSLLIFLSLFNYFYHHDTFFGGRDDGMYANLALSIVNNHSTLVPNDIVLSY